MTKNINTTHYRKHPSNIECITITRHMGFNLGNALKYIWRADHKNETPVEDLKKSVWYVLDQLYLVTGDSYYLNKRAEIENYSTSIEPLNGLTSNYLDIVGGPQEDKEIELDEAEVRRSAHKECDEEC